MPLPDFDPALHHFGLGPAGGTQKGYLITGGYRSDPLRAAAPNEFGGERDQLPPGTQARWTQDDFSGGAFQETFENDPAMFSYSRNFLPNLIERAARSVPPLVFWTDAGKLDASAALAVFASSNRIAVVFPTTTTHYLISDGTDSSTAHATNEVQVAAHDPTDNKIYAMTKHDTTGDILLRRYSHNLAIETVGDFSTAFPNFTASSAANPVGLELAGSDFIACVQRNGSGYVLFLCDVNDARTSTSFTRVGRLPGPWQDSCVYNGMAYILVTDREQRTSVQVWDGSQLLPVVEFPYNFIGNAITTYGGRLFVCGSGADVAGDDRYGELYEITGSSLRLVRTFAWEARAGIAAPGTLYEMVVHEGLLFIGTDEGYIIAYDLTRDALWARIDVREHADTDGTLLVKYLLSSHEKLFAWCDDDGGAGATSGDGFYRMASETADLDAESYTAYIESSDFTTQPAREKAWSEVAVLTRYAAAPTVEASIDGGANWSAVEQVSTSGSSSGVRSTIYDLSGLDASPTLRLRYSFSKNTVAMSELVATTVSFHFLDSGKRAWSFVVNAADLVEDADGGTLDQDTATLKTTLWDFWTSKTTLDYTDLDGGDYTVFVSDISESQPIVGPPLGDGSREAFYTLVLSEL